MNTCTYPKTDRTARPLAAKSLFAGDRAEQIRTAFGCGRNCLPTVDAATLCHCYRYLSENLSLPCAAWYPEPMDENGGYPCTVTELIDPASGLGSKFDGIFCKVRQGTQERYVPLIELELSLDDPNCQLLRRYCDCFWQWR